MCDVAEVLYSISVPGSNEPRTPPHRLLPVCILMFLDLAQPRSSGCFFFLQLLPLLQRPSVVVRHMRVAYWVEVAQLPPSTAISQVQPHDPMQDNISCHGSAV